MEMIYLSILLHSDIYFILISIIFKVVRGISIFIHFFNFVHKSNNRMISFSGDDRSIDIITSDIYLTSISFKPEEI